MNEKRVVFTAILLSVVFGLLVNRTDAAQIFVFAPGSYAGNPPSYPTAFPGWITYTTSGLASAYIDSLSGFTNLHANPVSYAYSQFSTGWWQFSGQNQTGSVHADTWIKGSIKSPNNGFQVILWVYLFPLIGTMNAQVWSKTWQYQTQGSLNIVVDLGINHDDVSWPDQLPFQWFQGGQYQAVIWMEAYASNSGSKGWSTLDGKFDDILFISYTGSPEPHWTRASSNLENELNLRVGDMGLSVDSLGKAELRTLQSKMTGAIDTSMGVPTLATIAAVSFGLYGLRRKTRTHKT